MKYASYNMQCWAGYFKKVKITLLDTHYLDVMKLFYFSIKTTLFSSYNRGTKYFVHTFISMNYYPYTFEYNTEPIHFCRKIRRSVGIVCL